MSTEETKIPTSHKSNSSRKGLFFVFFFALFLFLAVVVAIFSLRLPYIQTFIAQKGISYLSDKIGTEISTDSVYVDIYNNIFLQNLLVRDQQADTLLFAQELKVDVNQLKVLNYVLSINEVEINQAHIHLKAINDSTFNYQFIIDAFANSSNNNTNNSDNSKTPQYFAFELDKIKLNNTHFTLNDQWQFLNIDAQLPQIALETQLLDLQNNCFEAKYLHIEQPKVNIISYEFDDGKPEKIDTTLSYLPNLGFDLKIIDLQLKQGFVRYQGQNPSYAKSPYIDWENLQISPLNLHATDASYIADTIQMNIENISFKEISGFEVSQLKGEFLLNKENLILQELTLKTPNSSLSNRYALKYKNFEDFAHFETNIYQDIQLNNAQLDIKDIEYFVPIFSENDVAKRLKHFKKIAINGRIYGTIDNLKGQSLSINSENSYFEGDFKLKGLPNIATTFIDFDVEKLHTHINRITTLFPQVDFPENILKLGTIDFSGDFLGFTNDFVARGTLQTQMGNATTNLNMKINDLENATYSGTLNVDNFKLGEFLNQQTQMGNISFDTQINGSGLSLETINANILGKVHAFEFNGYTYKDITVDGQLDKKLFNGDFKIEQDDINLNFSGVVDLGKEKPHLRFESQIVRLDLQKINLSKEPIIVSFQSKLNLQGIDIDDFQGSANLENILIEKDGKKYPIKIAQIVSFQTSKNRQLAIASDVADVLLKGNFSFRNLSNTFKEYLTNYFPYNINYHDSLATRDLAIDFDIKLKKTTNLIQFFVPQLDTLSKGHIKGSFNNRSRYLNLNASLPLLQIQGVAIKNLEFDALSDTEEILFQLNVDTIAKDNIALPWINLMGFVHSDTLDIDLRINNDTAQNHLEAKGLAVIKDAVLEVQMKNLLLMVQGQDWRMKEEALHFKNWQDYRLQDWDLAFKDQFFRLSSFPDSISNTPKAIFEFKDINLQNYLDLAGINQTLKASGTLNGQVTIDDFLTKPLLTGDVVLTDAVLLDQQMGIIQASTIKKSDSNQIDITATVNSERYKATAKGYYDLNARQDEALFVEAQVERFSLVFLESLLAGEIYNTQGDAQGRITVSGAAKAPKINGELYVQDVETSLKLLNTHYKIEDQYVLFEDNRLFLEEMILLDKFNNKAELNGLVNLTDFENIIVSVDITTDKFLLLDTKRDTQAPQSYYGTALAAGFMIFDGPIDDMYMYLNLATLENTKIYLPLTSDYGVAENTVYSFVSKDTIATQTNTEAPFELKIDMDFELTPLAELQLIFDYQAGDIIKANGSGNIQMNYNTRTDAFDIYGEYTIAEGDYLFTLQNVINKRFDIKQGSTINFYGDPYKAQLDIETIYSFKTSLYELLDNVNSNNDTELRQRVPVELYLNLSNELAKPDINFFIDIPESSFNGANSSARQRIDQINTDVDKNELNKQVFGLMVFNKFLPQNTDLFDNEYLTSSVSTTMSEFLSNQFTSILDQTFGELIPNSEWGVNWRNYTTDYASADASDLSNTLQNRNEIELTYRQKLFNNRVIIDVGGNFDLGQSNSDSYDNVALAGDFVVQYKITPDGFYRVKFFAKTDSDIFTGRYNKTGLSLFITEDFDNLEDFFTILKNRRKAVKLNKKLAKELNL